MVYASLLSAWPNEIDGAIGGVVAFDEGLAKGVLLLRVEEILTVVKFIGARDG